ncbi:MAG TPA: beta-propeller fold lactonase family protein [Candidatus Acidoferrales bacterium]|nr:beta-propeller fold lactonase family protein [Candidatus Acidoferrales bacterium]
MVSPAFSYTVGGPPQGPAFVPDGQFITATVTPGSVFQPLSTGLRADGTANAAEAVTTALSPDGTRLLVLTSGYNENFYTETGTPIIYPVLDPTTGLPTTTTTPKAEWVFVFDVTKGIPQKLQQINIPDTYDGLAWDPNGGRFYVSGGGDDRIYAFKLSNDQYVPDAPFILLDHNSNQTAPFPNHDGGLLKNTAANAAAGGALATGAVVANIALSKDGTQIFAANLEDDSLSYASTVTRTLIGDTHFNVPGANRAVGEYPYDVAVVSGPHGKAAKVYVTSQRDDQVVAVYPNGRQAVIPVGGGPNHMLLTPDQSRLWVSNGNTATLSLINVATDQVVGTINLNRPGYPYLGANPNSLALSPDGRTLYVTLGGENAVAVVDTTTGAVRGRIPTGWDPNSVTVSANGQYLYVVNGKANAGPNPGNADGQNTAGGLATNTTYENEYGWALEKAGLLTIPLPIPGYVLSALSHQVDLNNGFVPHGISPLMAFLHTKIKHVIYIVNENRTYDQVLGDLAGGNGSPLLNLFPQAVGPNHHAFASTFGILDNYFDPGESSGVGWNWSMEGYDTDFVERHQSVDYGNGGNEGLTYDYQGTNRNLDVSLPEYSAMPSFFSERLTTLLDPTGSSNILPGPKDVGAPYGANNESPGAIGGYIFDSVLRAGGTIRNYGWQTDQTAYGSGLPYDPALIRYPYQNHVPQSPPEDAALHGNSDIYYRGFDQRYPDKFRIEEWQREYNLYEQNGNLPTLEMLTVPHDHFGDFSTAIEGLNTPTLQFADNDYALGELVQTVTQSKDWADTAIFIVEDDSQNGPDHVDSHRSTAFVISAYNKRNTAIHTPYTTENVLRTIEVLLGIAPTSFHDANAATMDDLFTTTPNLTAYTPIVPGVLCAAPVAPDLVGSACTTGPVSALVHQKHDGRWWAQHTLGYDFSVPDKIDPAAFNRLLWLGIKGDVPMPDAVSKAKSTPDND